METKTNDFVFDENKIKKALVNYCNKVNELYKAGNIESSYNKPIIDLIQLYLRVLTKCKTIKCSLKF